MLTVLFRSTSAKISSRRFLTLVCATLDVLGRYNKATFTDLCLGHTGTIQQHDSVVIGCKYRRSSIEGCSERAFQDRPGKL
nr:unnamed protein product [Spirometra erinaceieuropaei]